MFKDRVAIVTGAATGLGETIAEVLHLRGAYIVLADVDADRARVVAARFDPSGERTHVVETDVSDANAVEALVTATVDRFGGLHLAANNAGITGPHDVPLADTDWSHGIA